MEIKIDELWSFRGVEVQINDNLATEFLPKGTYTFVARENFGELRLYNPKIGFKILEEWNDDDIVVSFDQQNYNKRVDKLVEAQTALCIDLIGDGWSEDNAHFDLTHYLQDLKSYRSLQSLLKNDKG